MNLPKFRFSKDKSGVYITCFVAKSLHWEWCMSNISLSSTEIHIIYIEKYAWLFILQLLIHHRYFVFMISFYLLPVIIVTVEAWSILLLSILQIILHWFTMIYVRLTKILNSRHVSLANVWGQTCKRFWSDLSTLL